MERSVQRVFYTYSLIPNHVVNSGSISTSRRKLQNAVKQAPELENRNGQVLFKEGIKQMSVVFSQALFG